MWLHHTNLFFSLQSEKNNVQGAVNLQSGEIDLNTHACLMDETLEDVSCIII